MDSVNRRKVGRNNKSRSKIYENEVAAIVGGKRHLADTGGPEDVSHPWLAIQVKSGLALINKTISEGLDTARKAVKGKEKLPCLVAVHRGTRIKRYIIFDLDEFADWFKLVENGTYKIPD